MSDTALLIILSFQFVIVFAACASSLLIASTRREQEEWERIRERVQERLRIRGDLNDRHPQ